MFEKIKDESWEKITRKKKKKYTKVEVKMIYNLIFRKAFLPNLIGRR